MNVKGGFTLIEILMVIIILGILIAVGLPIYTGTVEKARAKEALDIMSSIKDAEARYMQQNASSTFVDITANDNYVASATGLDISWNTRYWNLQTLVPVTGQCNIIALRKTGAYPGSNITFSFTNTNFQGTWAGNHPAAPQNP